MEGNNNFPQVKRRQLRILNVVINTETLKTATYTQHKTNNTLV